MSTHSESAIGRRFFTTPSKPQIVFIYLGFCAGFDYEGERAVQKTLVERLPAKGFATLIVDPNTARGQANGVCDEPDTSGSGADRYEWRGAEDAYAALNALAKPLEVSWRQRRESRGGQGAW